ncbi:MAG: indole-3-glycerol phosphate synthase TrpC [Cytophagales bacterium]|nr:indole-3-glycerol phosphate synthase TrpC [Cytophagales bacterium]
MKNLLNDIIIHKKQEIAKKEALIPIKKWEESLFFETPPLSLISYLGREDSLGVIAEIKRSSPSSTQFNTSFCIEELSIQYMQAGASALSILTDTRFFSAKNEDLEVARKYNYCPILRKDFILNEYQLFETKGIGADVVLLIAACLEVSTCKALTQRAHQLGLEVLLEVHSVEEINTHGDTGMDLIGVNHRNLNSLEISMKKSEELVKYLPKGIIAVAESGISSPEQLCSLRKLGYRGFLIGTHFLRQENPGKACKDFITQAKDLCK